MISLVNLDRRRSNFKLMVWEEFFELDIAHETSHGTISETLENELYVSRWRQWEDINFPLADAGSSRLRAQPKLGVPTI